MTDPPLPWQLIIAMTTMGKAYTNTEKKSCISSELKPHPCYRITWVFIPPTLSKSVPFTSTLLCIWCLHLNWVEKLICELGAHFSTLWPLNKACIVPVSARVLLLAMNLTGKRTSWAGTRGLGPGYNPGMGLVDQFSNNIIHCLHSPSLSSQWRFQTSYTTGCVGAVRSGWKKVEKT